MEPDNLSLVALTPADMPVAQAALVAWCDQKLASVQAALTDLTQNLAIAKKNKWKISSLQAAVSRESQRVVFYEKIKAALEAGYLIIPNFPIDAFAVKVDQAKPRSQEHGYINDALTNTQPTLAPAGEGRYVDDIQYHRDRPTKEPNERGEMIVRHHYRPSDYDENWDFPFATVKPTVLTALQRAMALKVFDQMGTVRQRRGDPIIVGQIMGPKYGYSYRKIVTFFVAWWLNTEDL